MHVLLKLFISCVIFSLVAGCSLPPEKPVTRKQLLGTNVYRAYTIEESPEEILNALNMEGEVVVKAMRGKRPVFVKIMATAEGVLISSYDR